MQSRIVKNAAASTRKRFPEYVKIDHILLAITLIVGAALRLYTVDVGLFGDEQHTVRVVLHNSFQYIVTYHWGSYLHMILVHFFLSLEPMEIMARIPSKV